MITTCFAVSNTSFLIIEATKPIIDETKPYHIKQTIRKTSNIRGVPKYWSAFTLKILAANLIA